MKHKHHIIPKHAGGTDDPSNLIELTVEEHAEAHRVLYEQYGNEKDRIAWLGLSGIIPKQETIKELYKLGRKNANQALLEKYGPDWQKIISKKGHDTVKEKYPSLDTQHEDKEFFLFLISFWRLKSRLYTISMSFLLPFYLTNLLCCYLPFSSSSFCSFLSSFTPATNTLALAPNSSSVNPGAYNVEPRAKPLAPAAKYDGMLSTCTPPDTINWAGGGTTAARDRTMPGGIA
jgi:hypothetical protein